MMDIKSVSNTQLLQELDSRLNQNEATINEQKRLLKELVDLNSRLEESEKLKSHFLSNIRNEINNPLASILAISQNLLSRFKDDDGFLLKSLKVIYHEAFNLDFQIKNIMMAADLEAGESFPEYENINLNLLVKNVIGSFDSSIRKKDITTLDVLDEEIHIVTDQYFLNLILSNLVDNAIKFNKEGGKLTISAKNNSDQMEIRVTDEGVGINEDLQEQIFDRFAQLEKGTKKTFHGHGLGLSIVKELLDMLDGKLLIESEEHQGASFIIQLPINANKAQEGHVSYNRNVILFDHEEQF